jgi:hypothetical protein
MLASCNARRRRAQKVSSRAREHNVNTAKKKEKEQTNEEDSKVRGKGKMGQTVCVDKFSTIEVTLVTILVLYSGEAVTWRAERMATKAKAKDTTK